MEDMKIESKFDVDDVVWYFNDAECKFYQGTIKSVNNWDKWEGFRYELQAANNQMVQTVPEKKIFTSKQEIIENCFVEPEA